MANKINFHPIFHEFLDYLDMQEKKKNRITFLKIQFSLIAIILTTFISFGQTYEKGYLEIRVLNIESIDTIKLPQRAAELYINSRKDWFEYDGYFNQNKFVEFLLLPLPLLTQ